MSYYLLLKVCVCGGEQTKTLGFPTLSYMPGLIFLMSHFHLCHFYVMPLTKTRSNMNCGNSITFKALKYQNMTFSWSRNAVHRIGEKGNKESISFKHSYGHCIVHLRWQNAKHFFLRQNVLYPRPASNVCAAKSDLELLTFLLTPHEKQNPSAQCHTAFCTTGIEPGCTCMKTLPTDPQSQLLEMLSKQRYLVRKVLLLNLPPNSFMSK